MNQKTDPLAELRAAAEEELRIQEFAVPDSPTLQRLRAALDALPADAVLVSPEQYEEYWILRTHFENTKDAVLVSREEWEAKACPWCKMLVGNILERLREQVRDEIRAGRGEGA